MLATRHVHDLDQIDLVIILAGGIECRGYVRVE
jgi:hypothetical protein